MIVTERFKVMPWHVVMANEGDYKFLANSQNRVIFFYLSMPDEQFTVRKPLELAILFVASSSFIVVYIRLDPSKQLSVALTMNSRRNAIRNKGLESFLAWLDGSCIVQLHRCIS